MRVPGGALPSFFRNHKPTHMSTTTAPIPAAPAVSAKPAPKRASKLRAVTPDAAPKPEKLKALVYGLSGHGKSFLASAAPAVYYIDPEGGARLPEYQARIRAGGGGYLGRDQGAGDSEVVLEQLRELASVEHDFTTVAVDSVTKLFLDLQADEAERLGDKDQFGASKKPATRVMRRIAAWIQRLPLNVLLLAHA